MDEKQISINGWKVVRTIGKGGFGSVYEVEKDDGIGGVIRSALKVISIPEPGADITAYRDDGYDDASITALFKNQVEDITSEFRLMNKLKGCSNIVSFEDYSIVQHDNEPGYDIYIRMELLTPLPRAFEQELLQTGVSDETVRKLGVDMCRALELCSRYNIIHRDIKPQNIFINELGDFKLGDFGIAKTSDHTTRATKTGTFGYMAPEVYLSKPYNAAVDQYSLGLVLYWMLNERRGPFLPLPPAVPKSFQNAEALERRMAGERLPAPKHGSEALKRIVLKACAFDPKDRYANPTEMKRDLERLSFETDTERSYAEPRQINVPFAADENEKTFGVFGGKPSTPEEPQVQEDEKTFGVFGGKPSTPEEPQGEEDEKTFGAFGDRPMPPKETPVPVTPKKPEPVRTEAAAPNPRREASVPVEEDEKTFGVFGGKPSQKEESPVEEDEKTFGVFGARQPKEQESVPADDEATVSIKKPTPAKPAEKPVEPKAETKPVEPKAETKPVEPKAETKPVGTEPEQKKQPAQKEAKPVETENQKKKSKLPVILSIAAALVIAAVVLIVVLAGKGNTPSQPAQTAEQTPRTTEKTAQTAQQPVGVQTATTAPSTVETYDITVWIGDAAVDLTEKQIENFNKTNTDGITFNATVVPVSEETSADRMLDNVSAGADLYCFTQDRIMPLFRGSALEQLDHTTAKTIKAENDAGSVAAATIGSALYAYPMSVYSGYFMYYDKSVIPDEDVDSLEKLIADCEAANMWFCFDIQRSAWYTASWFFATGCVSEWTTDDSGAFIGVKDTFNSVNGLIAVKGMKKLLDSWIFTSYDGGDGFSGYSAVVVTGTWEYETVKSILGDNMGVTDLPSFEVGGKQYHLGSFNGCKLMGVKPQKDRARAAALHKLAQYLTDETRQTERFNALSALSWGPSNLNAQKSDAVQANPALAALLKQNAYASPQREIHGSWWDIAKDIATDVKAAKDQAGLWAALSNYDSRIGALFAMTDAWSAIGAIGGTAWDTDFLMTEVEPGVFETEPMELHTGEEFKVRHGANWDVNYGVDGPGGLNYIVEADGIYRIRFEEATGLITLVKVN